MKAAVYTNYGPPDIVQILSIDKPIPKEDEILIKVHASTVNRTDCGFRSANYFIVRFFSGLFRPKNKVLGCEYAGQIEAIGKNVTGFKIGDRVFGFNDATFGAHAEYMIVKEDSAISTIPSNIEYDRAAAITEGAHYALCDIRAAKITAGQNVLVNGATGAIGSAAVQIIKHLGATVTAVCATKHIDLVTSLGADKVIDYTKEDFTQLHEIFDVIFDAVGKSSYGKCKPLLKSKGIYMSTELGYMSQNPFLALITPIFGGKKLLFPIPTSSKKDVEFLKQLVMNKEFNPVIDKKYPLEQIVEAYTYVENGQKTGNVIITIA